MMYAVIESGGKQLRAIPGAFIQVEKLPVAVGDEVVLDKVLFLDDDKGRQIGQPYVNDVAVKAVVVEQARSEKIIVGKKKRRKNYRRRQGHRQSFTLLRVETITSQSATNDHGNQESGR